LNFLGTAGLELSPFACSKRRNTRTGRGSLVLAWTSRKLPSAYRHAKATASTLSGSGTSAQMKCSIQPGSGRAPPKNGSNRARCRLRQASVPSSEEEQRLRDLPSSGSSCAPEPAVLGTHLV